MQLKKEYFELMNLNRLILNGANPAPAYNIGNPLILVRI